MPLLYTDMRLRDEMQQLLDRRVIWQWLHIPAQRWTGVSFSGESRAVEWRLCTAIEHPFFSRMSIHQISTDGEWSYGHSHESSFVSFIVTESYESESWHEAPFYRIDEATKRFVAGDIIPFADVERYHRIRTQRPSKTIVLWTPLADNIHHADPHSAPRVELSRLQPKSVERTLTTLREDFMFIRRRMKRGF